MYRLLIAEDDKGIAEAIKVQAEMWNLEVCCIENFRNVMSDEESVIYDDAEWIAQVISDISNSKPTNKQSVQDVPQVETYIRLDLRLGEGTSTLFIYKDGENCYIEQPYQGIYEINSELYDLICETVNE